jgi:DNA-binding protein HU-beta
VHLQARIGHNVAMNKRELARAVAVQSDVELKTVITVIDGFTDVVTAVVAKGEPISIPGFAKFVKVNRPARMGRNPATGEAIRIKASKKARITPVKAFKDAVLAPATAPKLVKGAFPTDDAAVASAGKSAAPVAARATATRSTAKKAPAKKAATARKAPARKEVVSPARSRSCGAGRSGPSAHGRAEPRVRFSARAAGCSTPEPAAPGSPLPESSRLRRDRRRAPGCSAGRRQHLR